MFVKRIPLTDKEQRPGAVRSTNNLFDLPAHCYYDVGSPGFSAWRELAATEAASSWVRTGRHAGFPLLHHWRILPGAPLPADELHDIDDAVAY